MFSRLILGVTFALTLAGLQPIEAQTASNPVGAKSDWTIFVYDDPKQCWLVSLPQQGKSIATRDGRPVSVKRGDIFFFVSFWPNGSNGGGKGEVSFMGGYDFRKGEPVTVTIGDDVFKLFSEGDTAWAMSPEEDRKLAAAMKRGREAVVSGISERSGTTTKDTFSLIGFTAAFEDAAKRCGG